MALPCCRYCFCNVILPHPRLVLVIQCLWNIYVLWPYVILQRYVSISVQSTSNGTSIHLPYLPCNNGSIYHLDFYVSCIALVLYQLQLRPRTGPHLISILQSGLNHAPSPQFNKTFPVTILTGLAPRPPTTTFHSLNTSTPVNTTTIHL